MARKVGPMEFREILRRLRLKQGIREIHRDTGYSRELIRKVRDIAKGQGWIDSSKLADETEIAKLINKNNKTHPLDEIKDKIKQWLENGYTYVVITQLANEKSYNYNEITIRRTNFLVPKEKFCETPLFNIIFDCPNLAISGTGCGTGSDLTTGEQTLMSGSTERVYYLKLPENYNSSTPYPLIFAFHGLGQKFDLIFIDGDHHYDCVKSDTINVFRHLVHEKSIVVWHDYGFHPDQVRFEVLAAILDGIGQERRDLVYHVAHTKCAIYTGRKVSYLPADFPHIPESYFSTSISKHSLKGKTRG